MSRLVETIKSEDGILKNIEFHNARMAATLTGLFNISSDVDLAGLIDIPVPAANGLFKCRVEYDDVSIRKIEFIKYQPRIIRSLKLIEDDTIEYRYKFTDRSHIERLFEKRGNCDDILIIKNGYVTDASFANIIMKDQSGEWFTPSTFLLPGTMRSFLLRTGVIKEKVINITELDKFTEIRLINAMMSFDESAHNISIIR